jgi:hypothetical protein
MKTQRVSAIVLTSVMLFMLCIVSSAEISHGGAALNSAFHRAVVTEAADDIPVVVTVVVKDTEGHGISGARVVVHQSFMARWINPVAPPDYEKSTDRDGIARIPVNAKAGESLVLSFEISKENMQTETRRAIDLGKDFTKPLRELKFTLKALGKEEEEKLKPEETTTLKINVIRKDTGKGVQGAKVEVWVEAFPVNKLHTAYTDVNGDAVVVTKASDNFDVIASKALLGKSEKKIRNNLKFEKEIEVDLELEKPAGSAVSVTVRDVDTKLPVKDATVILDSKFSPGYYYDSTGDSGTASLVIPEGGTFSVRIKQDFYEQLSGKEIKVLESEDPQAFNFELKAKPKKSEIGNSVDVTVLQGDRIAKIQRTNLPLPDANIRIEQFGLTRGSGLTDRSGQVTITTDLEGEVQVVVEAEGYKQQIKTVRMTNDGSYGKAHAAATLVMQPSTAEDLIEVTVLSAAKRNEGSVPLAGVSVRGGEETTTTNVYGVAKLRGTFEGKVEVAVEKSGYLRQTKTVNASGGKGSASFTLQPEATEDTVSITIMGQDPKGGSPSPIAGAHILANGLTATTDRSGHAVITGNFKDGLEIRATADDFTSQVQQVNVTQADRTAVANFLLQPKTTLDLIIEVHDSSVPGKLLAGATISVYPMGKAGKTMRLANETTNAQGEASINFKGNTTQLSRLRSGLTLNVEKEKYKTRLTDVIPDSLQATGEEHRLTVFLERDWTELITSLNSLEARVQAWHNDYTGRSINTTSSTFTSRANNAVTRAQELMSEIEAAREAFGQAVPGIAGTHCRPAGLLKQDILSCESQANQKAQELKNTLDNATSVAAKCSPGAAENIRSASRKAIRLLGEIGSLNKKAARDRDELLPLAQQSLALRNLAAQLQGKVAEIGQQRAIAEEAARGAAAYNRQRADTSKTLMSRQVALNAEVAVLTVKYAADDLPLYLTKRIQAIEGLLGSTRNDYSFGTNPQKDLPDSVSGAAGAIDGIKSSAEKAIAQYQRAGCDIDTMDATVDGINTTLTNAGFEIGLAADLPKAADDCAKGVATDKGQPKGEEISDDDVATEKGDRSATGTEKITPPIVEELPEDKVATKPGAPVQPKDNDGFWNAAKAGKKDVEDKIGNKPAKGTKPPLAVEDIPDDDSTTNTSKKPARKGSNPPPAVEDDDDDSSANKPAGKENSQASNKTKKEKKPRDPNKPSTLEKIANVVDAVANPKNPPNTGGGGGNSSGSNGNSGGSGTGSKTTGGSGSNSGGNSGGSGGSRTANGSAGNSTKSGGTSGGSTGQGLDLSGTWEGPLKDSSGLTSKWTMVLKRTGTNEWAGTVVITQDPRAQLEGDGRRVSNPMPVKFVARGGGAGQITQWGYNYDATYTATQIIWDHITFTRR